jgi:hypothetical protein
MDDKQLEIEVKKSILWDKLMVANEYINSAKFIALRKEDETEFQKILAERRRLEEIDNDNILENEQLINEMIDKYARYGE